MAKVLAHAVDAYRLEPARNASIPFEGQHLRLTRKELGRLVSAAARNVRSHNARRSMLVTILVDRLYRRYVTSVKRQHGALAPELTVSRREASKALREDATLRAAIDEFWPLVAPQTLVGGLLGDRTRLAAAAAGILTDDEVALLGRTDPVAWTDADVPLLDEAARHTGVPVERKRVASLEYDDADDPETFGHVIVDEAQDLSPMALRMITRRSRTGSMTLVGDLAQSLGSTAPGSWDDVLAHLPQQMGTRVRELTVNYRTPGSVMDVAARILAVTAPDLEPPRSARADGAPIRFEPGDPARTVAAAAEAHRAREAGTLAVICARADLEAMHRAAGVGDGGDALAVVTVHEAKGLEFDHVVIVEPARIVASSAQGLRALYVALTRATQDVTVAHTEPLPDVLR